MSLKKVIEMPLGDKEAASQLVDGLIALGLLDHIADDVSHYRVQFGLSGMGAGGAHLFEEGFDQPLHLGLGPPRSLGAAQTANEIKDARDLGFGQRHTARKGRDRRQEPRELG